WPRRATLFYSRQRVRIPVASTAINIVARCFGAQSNSWPVLQRKLKAPARPVQPQKFHTSCRD
ncbi:uncharacterized protein METZ01_LOCUS114326, partial [marine metagenome]